MASSGSQAGQVVVRGRASIFEVPWLLASAVIRMMSRQLDDRRVRKLTSSTFLR